MLLLGTFLYMSFSACLVIHISVGIFLGIKLLGYRECIMFDFKDSVKLVLPVDTSPALTESSSCATSSPVLGIELKHFDFYASLLKLVLPR